MYNNKDVYIFLWIHSKDNRGKVSSFLVRRSPVMGAGCVREFSGLVPGDLTMEPGWFHSHVWHPTGWSVMISSRLIIIIYLI